MNRFMFFVFTSMAFSIGCFELKSFESEINCEPVLNKWNSEGCIGFYFSHEITTDEYLNKISKDVFDEISFAMMDSVCIYQTESDSDISVYLSSDHDVHPEKKGNQIGRCDLYTSGHDIIMSKVVISKIDFDYYVLMHEIMHALGMEHCDSKDDVMYPYHTEEPSVDDSLYRLSYEYSKEY